MSTFGERLRGAREKKGFNQKEFAAAIGVTPTRLNYWEKDKREPDFACIRVMIDKLECDADFLLGTRYGQARKEEMLSLQPEEANIIHIYRALLDEGKQYVQQTVRMAENTYLNPTVRVFRAAYSEAQTPPQYVEMSRARLDKLRQLPCVQSDDDI